MGTLKTSSKWLLAEVAPNAVGIKPNTVIPASMHYIATRGIAEVRRGLTKNLIVITETAGKRYVVSTVTSGMSGDEAVQAIARTL